MRRLLLILSLCLGSLALPTSVDAAGRCRQYEHLLVQYAPKGGWNVAKMSGYMHRESRCTPSVVSTTDDHGLLQVNRVNFKYLAAKFNVPVSQMPTWLKVPVNNVRAAAQLCRFWRNAGRSCYQPWRTS